MVHHIDSRESSRLLDKKHADLTDKLKKGQFILKDTSGDYVQLASPLSTHDDCEMVVKLLDMQNTNINETPVHQYQRSFKDYRPKELQAPNTTKPVEQASMPVATPPIVEDTPVVTFTDEQTNQTTEIYVTPVKVGKSGVDIEIEHRILTTCLELKSKTSIVLNEKEVSTISKDGRIVRTVLRDYLGMNNKDYSKLIVPVLNAYNL
jgi:hypothetical protein